MAYKDFCEKFKDLIAGWKKFAAGDGSVNNAEVNISAAHELNALRNAASSEQLVHLSNAYYDQVAMGRSIKELYKRPKDYLKDYDKSLDFKAAHIDGMNKEVQDQHERVKKTINVSKSGRKIAPTLQKKLSRIKSEFDL